MASLPPTGFLPSLVRLQAFSTSTIVSALENLQSFYWPLPVVARKLDPLIHDDSVPDSGYASAEEEDDEDSDGDAEYARSDPLERDYAIKWITRLIARGEDWVEDDETRSDILDDAARILSLFACNAKEEEECAVQRSFDFPNDVHVELNDAPLSVSDHTSVGLQSWASSILLAERMCASPADFCLLPGARILELGAGTGLLSIASAKLVQADIIVATDYHPDVLANLQLNVANQCNVLVRRFDWETPDYARPLDQVFDVILAADVVYHVDHATWIRRCVERLLAQSGVLWLMVAVRSTGRHEGLACTVDTVFPESEQGLFIRSRKEYQRKGGVGRADEGGYQLFEIGWKT